MATFASNGAAAAHNPSIHAFVFCWPGRERDARAIATAAAPHVERLTVIFKGDDSVPGDAPGEWVRVPDADYWGKQSRKAFEIFDGDVMLQLQADAGSPDWGALVGRCRHVFTVLPHVAIWSPHVFHTPHTLDLTAIHPLEAEGLMVVTETDGIVWAMRRPIVERLARLDYTDNNLGWGITKAAAAHALTTGGIVAVDPELRVEHPKGSSYNHGEALLQMERFLTQLTEAERAQIHWMRATRMLRRPLGERIRQRARLVTAQMRGRRLVRDTA